MNNLPQARSQDIIEQELNDEELLIYDLKSNTAYSLNETSRIVYKACNGFTPFEKLKNQHKLTDDLIFFALNELKNNNLLENYYSKNFTGMSRREVIRKVGLASVVALPLITSISAPKSVHAQSGVCGQQCSQTNDCFGRCAKCDGAFACSQSINISCRTVGEPCNVGDTCNTSNPANTYCNNTFTGPCTTDADCVGVCFDNGAIGNCIA